LNYRRYSGLEKRIYIRGRENIVCYSAVIPKLNGVRTLLSAVYDQGSYVAPVFHQGPLDELQELWEFLDKGQVKATYRPMLIEYIFIRWNNNRMAANLASISLLLQHDNRFYLRDLFIVINDFFGIVYECLHGNGCVFSA